MTDWHKLGIHRGVFDPQGRPHRWAFHIHGAHGPLKPHQQRLEVPKDAESPLTLHEDGSVSLFGKPNRELTKERKAMLAMTDEERDGILVRGGFDLYGNPEGWKLSTTWHGDKTHCDVTDTIYPHDDVPNVLLLCAGNGEVFLHGKFNAELTAERRKAIKRGESHDVE